MTSTFGLRATFSLACGIAVSLSGLARATAPAQQTTNPTAFSNFFSVVDMLQDPSTKVGTGSIIDSEYVTQGNQQIGYFCVLTADHVNTPPGLVANQIGFGYAGDGNNSATSFAQTYSYVKVAHGGATGNEDISVAVVRYGVVDPFFASVKDLKLWTPPANITLASLPSSFTQVGYGNTGVPHYTGGVQDGFTFQNSFGVQRFDNANPASTTAGAAHDGYTYTDVTWNPGPVSPGNPNLGTGSSFTADSGGPYFTTARTNFTVNGLTDVLGNPVPPQTISTFSDTIFAVHTFGNNMDPQLFSQNIPSGGVVLTAADIAWIQGICATVPEPSTWLLASIGVIGMLAMARRRAD
jgi:hypothetical protein